MTIWKFPLEITDEQFLLVPSGGKPMAVAEQNGVLCIWFLVDQRKKPKKHRIAIFGTGNPCDESDLANYVGTIAMSDGFVWHVFANDNLSPNIG